MVTKEAAMSFSQFGYPYNATSQVRYFLNIFQFNLFSILSNIFFVIFQKLLLCSDAALLSDSCFNSIDKYFH